MQLYKSTSTDDMELLAEEILPALKKPLQLKITSQGSVYHFSYALKNNKWKTLKAGVDAKFLSTQTAGGFVGCVYAIYATSQGAASSNKVYFDWFKHWVGKKVIYFAFFVLARAMFTFAEDFTFQH